MTDFIVCAAANLFRIYLISRFVHIFVGDDKQESSSRIKHMLVYGVFFVVNTAAYLIFHRMWVNIACNLLGIGLIVSTYTRSLKTRIHKK